MSMEALLRAVPRKVCDCRQVERAADHRERGGLAGVIDKHGV